VNILCSLIHGQLTGTRIADWRSATNSFLNFIQNKRSFREISSSSGGEYEAQNLLGCTAVFLIECRPTFRSCVLPPSSRR
jgi:hypothetical protein